VSNEHEIIAGINSLGDTNSPLLAYCNSCLDTLAHSLVAIDPFSHRWNDNGCDLDLSEEHSFLTSKIIRLQGKHVTLRFKFIPLPGPVVRTIFSVVVVTRR
jgi:hypothetical protein